MIKIVSKAFVTPTIAPPVRLVAATGFALAVVGLNHWPALLAALALAGLTALAARVKPAVMLQRLAVLDGFMIFVVAALPFTVPGSPAVTVAGVALSQEGLIQAAVILLKSNAVVLMMLALLGSLELVEVGQALASLRLPVKFVTLFLFTVRYIEVLGREYRRLRTAMKARGFTMRCDLHTWRSIGYLFGMLMVQSLERSERIVAAMRCRGFHGHFPSLAEAEAGAMAGRDHAFAAAALVVCLMLFGLEYA